jgi:NAD(P)-dependent dehydrogenase (short-subunit alcohol dehydrogenase family)
MDLGLKGRVALVAGGSGGIGKAIAMSSRGKAFAWRFAPAMKRACRRPKTTSRRLCRAPKC